MPKSHKVRAIELALRLDNCLAETQATLERIEQYLGHPPGNGPIGAELYRHGIIEGDSGPDSITPQILVRTTINKIMSARCE